MELQLAKGSTYPITFVFEEKYQKDSTELIKNLSLKKYQAKYVWSDSLFDVRSTNGISSFNLVNQNGDIILKKPLKTLSNQDLKSLVNHPPSTDTLLLSTEIAKNTYQNIFSDGNKLYFCNSGKMRIDVVNIADGKYIQTFQVDRKNVKTAFDKVLGKGAYDFNKRELARLKVPNPESIWYYAVSDSCLVTTAAYHCIQDINKADTVVSGFYSVNTFQNNSTHVNVFPDIPFTRKTFIKDGDDLFSCIPAIHYYNGAYFGGITKSDTIKNISGRKFLAKFKAENGRFKLLKLFDYRMPETYKNGNNSWPLFYKNYVMLPLANKIYTISEQKPIEIKGLTFKVSEDFFTPPDKYIDEFKVKGNLVTIVYNVMEKKQHHLFRYDIKKEKIIFDKVIPSGRKKPIIDWNNNDYVYYQVSDNKIIRQHHESFN